MKKEYKVPKFNPLYAFYRNKDYVYETLNNRELFLSFPRYFNDPYDCKPLIDLREFEYAYLLKYGNDEIKIHIKRKPGYTLSLIEEMKLDQSCNGNFQNVDFDKMHIDMHNLHDQYYKRLVDISNEYGVACFTRLEPEKNMVMWAHYAENYEGICAKYELTYLKKPFKSEKKDMYTEYLVKHIRPVKYKVKLLIIDSIKLIDIPLDELKTNSYVRNYVKKILYCKQKQWTYEQECRLVLHKDDKRVKMKQAKNGFKIKFDYLNSVSYFYDRISLPKKLMYQNFSKGLGILCYPLVLDKGMVKLVTNEKELFKESERFIYEKYAQTKSDEDVFKNI